METGVVVLIVVLVLALMMVVKSVTVIHQAEKGLVERWGRYKETLDPGLRFLIPGNLEIPVGSPFPVVFFLTQDI